MVQFLTLRRDSGLKEALNVEALLMSVFTVLVQVCMLISAGHPHIEGDAQRERMYIEAEARTSEAN